MTPIVLFMVLLAGNLISWERARDFERKLTLNRCESTSEELALRLNLYFSERKQNLALLANLWRRAPSSDRQQTFLRYAKDLIDQQATFDAVYYADADKIMMVTPPLGNRDKLIGIDLLSRPTYTDVFQTVRKFFMPLDAPITAKLTRNNGLVIWSPVVVDKSGGVSVEGMIAGTMNLNQVISQVITPWFDHDFWVMVLVEGRRVFSSGPIEVGKEGFAKDILGQKVFSALGHNWEILVLPKDGGAYQGLRTSEFPRLLMQLVISALASVLLGIALISLKRLRQNRLRLLRLEQRYQLLVESAQDAIIVLDSRGGLIEANQSACRSLGFTHNELIRMSFQDIIDHEHPIDIEMLRLLDDDQGHKFHETSYVTRSGEKIPVEISAKNIDYDGRAAVLSIARNISARKRADGERLRLERQLQQARKMESIGTLAGGIAHDFNNLLGSILAYTQMAMINPDDAQKTRHRLEQVFKAANIAKELVRQILTFSRRSEIKPLPIKLSPIIKETLKLLRSTVPSTIEIHQDLAPETRSVMTDPIQIQQVIMNLCTNATQAMEKNQGELHIKLKEIELTPALAKNLNVDPGPYLQLAFIDNGMGMEPKVADHIFEPYFTTKDRREGTGMGLAVVHGIVSEYNGAITVDTKPGKGSTFKVYFPQIDSKPPPNTNEAAGFQTGKERIMLVDDDRSLLEAGCDMLTYLGYEVDAHDSADEAWRCFQSSRDRYHLVILDQTMPKMTGAELAAKMLAMRPNLPIIICTGYHQRLDFDELRKTGIKSLLLKPLVLEDLAPALRTALESKEQ
ncbi:MAG: ATP-binding protein [Thermodesulfobacteriota bacterium]